MVAGVHVGDLVSAKRLEIRSPDGQKIVVDRKVDALYVPPPGDIRARYRQGYVYVLLGAKMLQMTTPIAAKVGFALAKNGGACMYHGDVVLLEIGGEQFTLLPAIAVQLGAVMMRKADRADDWQRGISQT